MKANEFQEQLVFDASLKVGMSVIVRWTNSGWGYQATGKIIKLNLKSLVVELDKGIVDKGDVVVYPVGSHIRVPRITDFRLWTANNCCLQLNELPPNAKCRLHYRQHRIVSPWVGDTAYEVYKVDVPTLKIGGVEYSPPRS